MKNECGPDKQQDVAEAPPQIGGGKRDPLQDELPADSIDPENDHCETEPEKISDRKSVIALGADLEAGRGQTFHKDGEGSQ